MYGLAHINFLQAIFLKLILGNPLFRGLSGEYSQYCQNFPKDKPGVDY